MNNGISGQKVQAVVNALRPENLAKTRFDQDIAGGMSLWYEGKQFGTLTQEGQVRITDENCPAATDLRALAEQSLAGGYSGVTTRSTG